MLNNKFGEYISIYSNAVKITDTQYRHCHNRIKQQTQIYFLVIDNNCDGRFKWVLWASIVERDGIILEYIPQKGISGLHVSSCLT